MSRKQKEENLEIQMNYFKQKFEPLNSHVKTPPSLDGKILLNKMEQGILSETKNEKPRFWTRTRFLSWQAGAVYAASVLLLVMVGKVIYNPPMLATASLYTASETATFSISGAMPAGHIDPLQESESVSEVMENHSETVQDDDYVVDVSSAVPASASTVSGEVDIPPSTETEETNSSFSEDELVTKSNQVRGFVGGVPSQFLGESDLFDFVWRVNDPNDIDKIGFPVTVEIIAKSDGAITSVDIEDISSIDQILFVGDSFTVIGQGTGGTVFHSYVMPEQAGLEVVPLIQGSQPGRKITAFQDGEYIYLASSVWTQPAGNQWETLSLADSIQSGYILISSYNLVTASPQSHFYAIQGCDSVDIIKEEELELIISYQTTQTNLEKTIQLENGTVSLD